MLKSEMERMVKNAGGILEIDSLEVNGRTLRIGQTKEASSQTIDSFSANLDTLEIIAFAPPAARGRIDKWDDGADVPSIIVRKSSGHPASEYEIRIAWEF